MEEKLPGRMRVRRRGSWNFSNNWYDSI